MKLADGIAQYRTPFLVGDCSSGAVTRLNNAADCSREVAGCALRFVLTDDLTGLCTALAYSRGARTLSCTDLLHVPAERVWVEWCTEPWRSELERYGFAADRLLLPAGRRGALLRATPDGRRGTLRTFWSGARADEVLASSVEAYFDLDAGEGEDPAPPDCDPRPAVRVFDGDRDLGADVLGRCFRFRYERSWSEYYARAGLAPRESAAVLRHALGTISIDVPLLLAFFLLLATRSGLPRHVDRDRLNRSRTRLGRPPLLDHIEVRAPLLPEYPAGHAGGAGDGRRFPRLHHVRGHLVRRGSQLFWRVPHLRGSARAGSVRTRTVTWTFDPAVAARGEVRVKETPALRPAAC
ncbi:MAG TPA: hypothetical protein VFK87_04055 [Steroidobacteraceae bacterium]|nr:hypothetical protein [Steroidobacteraceae bacterium]